MSVDNAGPWGVRQGGSSSSGFVLVEVMATAVVLLILLTSLADAVQSAVGQALRLRTTSLQGRDQAVVSCEGSGESAAEACEGWMWDWASQVTNALWREEGGLCLEVRCPDPSSGLESPGAQAPGRGLCVGLWKDGWFLGQYPLPTGSLVDLPAERLSLQPEEELVLRLRPEGGTWGPPYRLMGAVEDEQRHSVAQQGLKQSEPKIVRTSLTGEETLIHLARLATPSVAVSGAAGALKADNLLATFFLQQGQGSRVDLAVGGRLQSWCAEPGRALDVYF